MTPAPSNFELVQKYISGRLPDAERSVFETQLLTDASLVRDLEESLRLREGLEVLRERQELVGLKAPRRRPVFFIGFASASAAALAIIALAVAQHYVHRSPAVIAASVAALRLNATAPLTVVERYSFATPRAATPSPNLTLPTSGALELRALTPVTDAPRRFRVTLAKILDNKVTSPIGVAAVHLAPDADGFVVIYADASKLQPGDYSLSVDPEDESAGEHFAFRLTRVP
jgi:hypothetical protein